MRHDVTQSWRHAARVHLHVVPLDNAAALVGGDIHVKDAAGIVAHITAFSTRPGQLTRV